LESGIHNHSPGGRDVVVKPSKRARSLTRRVGEQELCELVAVSRCIPMTDIDQDTGEVAVKKQVAREVGVRTFAHIEHTQGGMTYEPAQTGPVASQVIRGQKADIHAGMQDEGLDTAA
jgi:hypothetical protein